MKFFFIVATFFLVGFYFIVNFFIGEHNFTVIKNVFNKDQKSLIKKYVFPYKHISLQEEEKKLVLKKLKRLQQQFVQLEQNKLLLRMELLVKNKLFDLKTLKVKSVTLDNGFNLKKYQYVDGFINGINNKLPGSGYLDFHDDKLVILSARGILAYQFKKNENKLIFKQIKNNIEQFINFEQYQKQKWFSIKDLHVHNNKIFISYTEEIQKDCWNTSVIFSEINYQNIEFKKLFSNDKCIHSKNNVDKIFNAFQSGGRIISLDNNHIVLSVGEYRSRFLAQDKNSINGKLLKINLNDASYKIISMGHRNPQGLYYDKENNFILSTEHGPQGGDEINLINLNDSIIPNFGWPIASYGEHYRYNKMTYEKYPLLKSHSKNGFIEPLKKFVPSIGISEITKININTYVTSSMKHSALYLFNINDNNQIINFEKIIVGERVRDIVYKNTKLYLFLEDTASIGVIDLQKENNKKLLMNVKGIK